MTTLNIESSGFAEVNVLLYRMADVTSDFTPVWPDVRDEIWQLEEEQFASQGRGNWAPLSPGYAKWKSLAYAGSPLLVREGDLRVSLTGPNPGAVVEMEPMALTVGTDIPYAIYHQIGTSRMPARPPMELYDEDSIGRLAKVIRDYLDKEIKEAGR